MAASLKLAMALDAAVVVFYISQICSGLDVVASRCVRKEKTSNNNFLNLKKKFTAVSTTTKNTQRYYCAMFSYPRLGKK